MKNSTDPSTGPVITFAGQDVEGSPRSITLQNARFRPLGYAELVNAVPGRPLTVPLVGETAEIASTTFDGLVPGAAVSLTASLESHFTAHAISLVRGGWLPPPLAARAGSILLVDRNVVSDIAGRFKPARAQGRTPDFLDLFGGQTIRINPLLAALEGNNRSVPTEDQIRNELNEATAALRRALPKAEILVGQDSVRAILGLLHDARASFDRKHALLLELAPVLSAPTARTRVASRLGAVFAAANRHEVPIHSLLVLAIISSIAVPNARSPAFTLLNLRRHYAAEHAYNALCDLRSLEIFIHLLCFFPGEDVHLCTGDRDLAKVWTGLQFSNIRASGLGVTFDVEPVEDLVPAHVLRIWREATGAGGRTREQR
jgi:hypothetical protein